jgi:LacI family transcriptional regulator
MFFQGGTMVKSTIKQVAAEANVSTATVSRVITGSGFVSDEVKRTVYAAIEKLNYLPNAVARSLKQDKTHTIGVIIPDISNPFFMAISRGIEDVVHSERYHLIFCSSDENHEKESELLQLLQEKRVDALVLATTGQNDTEIARLSRAGLPIVLLDRRIDDPQLKLDIIAEDNFLGAYQLTCRLLEQGHKRFGVVNGFLDVSTGHDRYAGYLEAIREAGLPEEVQFVHDGEFSVEGGMRAVRQFMKLNPKPTAILSFNNNMTFGALQELMRMGMRVPDDVKVATYGEVEAALLLKDPEIVYVRQNPYGMGLKTGEILLKRLRSNSEFITPESFIFTPELSTNHVYGRK